MKVDQAVTTYGVYKQSLGMRFVTEARTLKSFSKSVGNVELDRIGSPQVRIFLDGNGPMTRFWHRKFSALSGFYRFCLARGYCRHVPLPTTRAKCPQSFTPLHLLRGRDQAASQGRGRTRSQQHLRPGEPDVDLAALRIGSAHQRGAEPGHGRRRPGRWSASYPRDQVLQDAARADGHGSDAGVAGVCVATLQAFAKRDRTRRSC